MVEEGKLIVDFVDSDGLLTGIVLKTASDEGLGEEEPAHPEYLRRSSFDPFTQKFNPSDEIFNPTSKRFETQEADVRP